MKFLSIFILLSFLFIGPLSAQSLTALVGVGEHVITSREVQIFYGIRTALESTQSQPIAPGKQFNPGSDEFTVITEEWTRAWMIYFEAENFDVAQVRSEELESALIRVREAVKAWALWPKLEVGDEELKRFIKVWIRSQRFLGFKRESTAVTVSDAEVQEYFEENKARFGNLPFSSFEQNIRRFLVQQRLNERINEWFEVLRRKHGIKHFPAPGAGLKANAKS